MTNPLSGWHLQPRLLHPVAWWVWAIGAAMAVSRTRNPLGLTLIGAAVLFVADRRHRSGPGGRAIAVFVRLGLVVMAIRMALTIVLGARLSGRVLFAVPSPGLPGWLDGLQVGGPVTLEMLLASLYEGLRLALLLICFGAVNALASPYRLVRALPPVLHEAGVAVTVGVTLAPQLVVSATRVRAARRLRGRPGGLRGVRGTVMPVLEGALERAVQTAASMDARGYGRTEVVPPAQRRTATLAMLIGLAALVVGTYGLLDGSAPAPLALVGAAVGAVSLSVGLVVAGRRTRRSTHRPDRWRAPEWLVSGAGVMAGAVFTLFAHGAEVAPVSVPATWPVLGAASVVAAGLLATAAFTSPPVSAPPVSLPAVSAPPVSLPAVFAPPVPAGTGPGAPAPRVGGHR